MTDRDELRRLRALVHQRNGTELVAMLRAGPWPEDSLQLVGEGLVAAVQDDVEGTADVARACIERLAERGWRGDEELAEALGSALGTAPTRLLRPLPVDLEQLSSILEGDPVYGGGYIDLESGAVHRRGDPDFDDPDDDEDGENFEDRERWLPVDSEGSRSGYGDMAVFIGSLEDPDIADRLEIAIQGRGAFRRFKDTLWRWPELLDRWHAFSDDRHRGRAREWLADAGYTPTLPRD